MYCYDVVLGRVVQRTVSCIMFVCPSVWDTLVPTGWIFVKFYIGVFY
jgi:hypothetical protein